VVPVKADLLALAWYALPVAHTDSHPKIHAFVARLLKDVSRKEVVLCGNVEVNPPSSLVVVKRCRDGAGNRSELYWHATRRGWVRRAIESQSESGIGGVLINLVGHTNHVRIHIGVATPG